MSAGFPWLKVTLSGAGIIGVGYLIMRATVPTPEETYAAMSPDLRRKVDANRAVRLARETATKHQESVQLNDPDSKMPIWANSSSRP